MPKELSDEEHGWLERIRREIELDEAHGGDPVEIVWRIKEILRDAGIEVKEAPEQQ